MKNVEYTPVRDFDGIKEAQINIGDKTINIAVAHTLNNAKSSWINCVLENVNMIH